MRMCCTYIPKNKREKGSGGMKVRVGRKIELVNRETVIADWEERPTMDGRRGH